MEFGPAELVQGQLFSRTPVLDSIRNEELGKNSIDEATAGTTSGIQPDQPASVIKRFVLWSDRRSEFCGLAGPTCRCHQTVDFPVATSVSKTRSFFGSPMNTYELMRPRRCAFAKKTASCPKNQQGCPKNQSTPWYFQSVGGPYPRLAQVSNSPCFGNGGCLPKTVWDIINVTRNSSPLRLYVNGPSNNPRLRFNPSFQRLIIGWHVRRTPPATS